MCGTTGPVHAAGCLAGLYSEGLDYQSEYFQWESTWRSRFGVRSRQTPQFGDVMKRLAALVLLAIFTFTWTVQASAKRLTPEQNARQSNRAAKQQRRMLKKADKRQRKAMKRSLRAQRKATRKANRDLRKRRGV